MSGEEGGELLEIIFFSTASFSKIVFWSVKNFFLVSKCRFLSVKYRFFNWSWYCFCRLINVLTMDARCIKDRALLLFLG